MMSSFNIILASLSIIAVVNFILSVVIFSRSIRSLPNLLFALIALTCAVWCIAIIGFYSEPYRLMLNWVVITHASALLISLLFLIFSLHFPQKIANNYLPVFLCIASYGVVLYILLTSKLIIGDIIGYRYEINEGYLIYSFMMFAFFAFGFIFLLKQYKVAKDKIQKNQVKYVLIGSFVASMFAIAPDLILPYLNIFEYTWLGPIFTLLMVISLFLAMLRYRLFNIRIIFTEIVSVSIVIALIVELFFAKSIGELFFKTLVLIVVTIFTYLLIRGVYKEVEQKEALEVANAGQESLIHIMHHQIKGYLGKNRNIFAELLTDDYGVIPDTAKPIIEEGLNQSAKGVDYVQSILRGASAATGMLPYEMQKVDFKLILDEVITNQMAVIETKKISLNRDIVSGDYQIVGDKVQLTESLRNLIENAIRYNRPGGYIEIKLKRSDREIYLEVKDNGYGVDEDVKPRLFTPGGRSKNSTKYNPESSGFGLAFVKGVIERHAGTVGYKPNVKQDGSTFYVKIDCRANSKITE